MTLSRSVALLSLASVIAACGDDSTSTAGSGGAASSSSNAVTTTTAATSTSATSSSTTSTSSGQGGDGGTSGTGGSGPGTGGNGPGTGGNGQGTGGAGGAGGGTEVGSGTGGHGGTGGAAPACCQPFDSVVTEPAVANDLEPIAESGTRLRARWLDGGDGARLFQGFYDEDLETDCTLGFAEDESLRCLPTADTSILYLDNDCTVPAIVVNACDQGIARPYARTVSYIESEELCGLQVEAWTYYEVDNEAPLPTSTAYIDLGGGNCQFYESSQPFDLYAVGDQVDPTTFAEATPELEDLPGDLSVRAVVTDDGARQVGSIIDDRYGVCFAEGYANGRCSPQNAGYPGYSVFLNAQCDMPDPDSATAREGCGAPSVMRSYDFDACVDTFFEPEATEAPYVRDEEGTCIDGEGIEAYAVGAPIDDLAALDYVGVGSGRLRALTYASEGVTLSQPSHFTLPGIAWDTELETPCYPYLLGDDFRCIPMGAGVQERRYYADPACTVPIVGAATACNAAPFTVIAKPLCGAYEFLQVYGVGASYSGPIYTRSTDDTCFAFDPGGSFFEAIEMGDDELAAFEVVVD